MPQEDDGRRQKRTQREKFEEKLKAQEAARFKTVQEKIQAAIQNNPDMAKLANNILVDVTPEGLRIQVIDQEGASMFPSGSARMFQKTKELFSTVADIIKTVPNNISVRGHTDSSTYGAGASYTNWELSADRANSSRQVLMEAGIPEPKVFNVQGKSDTEHLFPSDPLDPRNRRVSIILLNEDFSSLPLPPGMAEATPSGQQSEDVQFLEDLYDGQINNAPATDNTPLYNKSQGTVEFP